MRDFGALKNAVVPAARLTRLTCVARVVRDEIDVVIFVVASEGQQIEHCIALQLTDMGWAECHIVHERSTCTVTASCISMTCIVGASALALC